MQTRMMVILFLCCGIAWGQNTSSNTVGVYSLGYVDIDTATASAAELVGESGKIIADHAGHRLIVTTTPDRQKLVAELIRGLDVAPANVRIEVHIRQRERQTERSGQMGGTARGKTVSGGTTTRVKVNARVVNDLSGLTEDMRQLLLVASGKEGVLRVGESVPYLEWLVDYGLRGGYLQPNIRWQEVGSFLTVQPRISGNGRDIIIRITPELRGLVNNNPLRVRYSGVTTEVVVRDGETVDVGGLGKDAEFYSRFLVGGGRTEEARQLHIQLTPHIEAGGR